MGAMVGYIQDMEFDQILEEINSHIATYEPSIPLLSKPVEGWQRQGVSYLIHLIVHLSPNISRYNTSG